MRLIDSLLITVNIGGITFGVFAGNWVLTAIHAVGLFLCLAVVEMKP